MSSRVEEAMPEDDVRPFVVGKVPAAPRNGEVGRGRDSNKNIIANKPGPTAANAIARIRRDHPELIPALESGELTPHAAAIKAGFVGPITQAEVGRHLAVNAEPLAANGEIGRGRDSLDNIKANKGGTGAEYTARRLRRDRPELVLDRTRFVLAKLPPETPECAQRVLCQVAASAPQG